MSSNKPINEKVLKIFSSIRCLSKDQLPRYLEGRLTDLEKHLVEQHLTDCDLCFDALQALEKEGTFEKYQDLTNKLQHYVHKSIQPVSHTQKVAQYTRKEKNKEHLLVYFWLFVFIGIGIGSIYVLKGYLRNQPPINKVKAAILPMNDSSQAIIITEKPIVSESNTPAAPSLPVKKDSAAVRPAQTMPEGIHKIDSAAVKKAAMLKAIQKKAQADSIARTHAAMQKQKQDSVKKELEKKEEAQNTDTDKPVPKPEPKKKEQAPPEASKKEPPATPVSIDEFLYKAAMVYQQQGNLNEAIDRYKRIEATGSGKYVEMARYQLAICYRSKGQISKARRMLKEVIRMDGTLKNTAQEALDSM